MKYNNETLKILNNYIENFNKQTLIDYPNSVVISDKINHIYSCVNLLNIILDRDSNYKELLKIAIKFHDIGRRIQMDKIGNFNDRILSHNELGYEYIVEEIKQGNLIKSRELDIIMPVVRYQDLMEFTDEWKQYDEETIEVIKIVTKIDRTENSCISALNYLEREISEDAKGYRKNNPNMDMKSVSPNVFEFYKNGQFFDKNVHCYTYADYILFAAGLSIAILKSNDHLLAKRCMSKKDENGQNIVDKYSILYNKYIDRNYSEKCIKILKGFYNDQHYKYELNA